MNERDGIYIGKMDRRIEIIKRIKTKGSTGAEVFTENVLVAIWAEKKMASTDKVLDEKVVAMNVVQFTIRWHPLISGENLQSLYIKQGDDEFEIYGFEEVGRKQFMKLKCQYRE